MLRKVWPLALESATLTKVPRFAACGSNVRARKYNHTKCQPTSHTCGRGTRCYGTKVKEHGKDVREEPQMSEPKPFSAIPGPKGLPVVGTLFDILHKTGKWHDYHEERMKTYGNIWKESVGDLTFVLVSDADGVRDIVRQEGAHPNRAPITQWIDSYKELDQPLGLFQAESDAWQRIRKAVDKPILKPNLISRHVGKLREVATDFVNKLAQVQERHGEVPDIDKKLFRWTMESVCVVLYERRIGCLSDDPPKQVAEFIHATHEMLRLSGELIVYPRPLIKLIKRKEWTDILSHFRTLFENAEKEIAQAMANPDGLDPESFIGYVLTQTNLSPEEVRSTVSEFMTAGIDTTSSTMQALLWHMGRDKALQEKIYQEVSTRLASDAEITYQSLEKMTYTVGAIKEVLRMYPPSLSVSRRMPRDVVVSGYKLPAGTEVLVSVYNMGRNPKVFDEPDEYRPERWIRSHRQEAPGPFSFASFGLGQRSCVGRRIAYLELQLLCVELLSRFSVSTTTPEFKLKSRFILSPEKPIQLTLTPRM